MPPPRPALADALDALVVPEKGRDVDAPPGQIADVIETPRRVKIPGFAKFQRHAQPVAVSPVVLHVPNRNTHLPRGGTWLSVLPHPFGLQVQPSARRTPLRLPIQPTFQDGLFRQGELPEVVGGKIRDVDPLYRGTAGGERGTQQAQQHDRPPAGRPPRQHGRSDQHHRHRRPDDSGRPLPAELTGQKGDRQQNEQRLPEQGVEPNAGRGQDDGQAPGLDLGHGRGAHGRGAVTPAAGRPASGGESHPPAPA